MQNVLFFNSLGQVQTVAYNSINNGEYLEANISDLKSGVYFLEIVTTKQKVLKRFIKE
ncbi:MAG: T9SS type A sorting domain-containing protein [Bacteroidetes bacterium]|nr:MAG: T9SS type A sorting domain-containing protein [Bacteroidota bacterium]